MEQVKHAIELTNSHKTFAKSSQDLMKVHKIKNYIDWKLKHESLLKQAKLQIEQPIGPIVNGCNDSKLSV